MIEINNISLSYGDNNILQSINYKFENNKVYGLIGRNGAGKSSLLKSICRLNIESNGNIFLDGDNITNKDYLEIPISFVSDTPVYYSDLTIKEHLLLISKINKISKNIALDNINNLIDLLKLNKYSNSFPNSLSRGTLQRLNIAIGLIKDNNHILMDEPFITLDPVQVNIVEDLILTLKENGKTFLISSHDIDSLESICDKYLILKDGKILEFNPGEIDKNKISKIINDSYED